MINFKHGHLINLSINPEHEPWTTDHGPAIRRADKVGTVSGTSDDVTGPIFDWQSLIG